MKEKSKKAAYIGGAAAGVAATIIATVMNMSGSMFPMECSYEIQSTSSVSSRVTLTIPYEQTPNATFYSLVFQDETIGLSMLGETKSSGVNTANILLTPIEKLSVAIYNGDMQQIGYGSFLPNGKITVNMKKDEVTTK